MQEGKTALWPKIIIKNILKLSLFFILGCTGFSLLHGLSLVVVSRDYSVVVRGLLLKVASFVAEHRL